MIFRKWRFRRLRERIRREQKRSYLQGYDTGLDIGFDLGKEMGKAEQMNRVFEIVGKQMIEVKKKTIELINDCDRLEGGNAWSKES